MLIPKEVVAGIPFVAATEEKRYAIHGVQITRTGETTARAVATDGKALLVADWNDGGLDGYKPDGDHANLDTEVLIPSKEMRKARTLAGNGTALHLEEGDINGTARLTGVKGYDRTRGIVEIPTLEGTFPDYEEIISKEPQGFKVNVGAGVLGNLLKAIQETTGHKDATVTLTFGKDAMYAVRVDVVERNNGDVKVHGVFMPVSMPE